MAGSRPSVKTVKRKKGKEGRREEGGRRRGKARRKRGRRKRREKGDREGSEDLSMISWLRSCGTLFP